MIWLFIFGSLAVGLGMYLAVGGLFEVLYYRRRRHEASDWKCQPERWTPERLRRRDLLLGTFNMSLGSLVSGLIAYYIATGGRSGVYFDLQRHGLLFSIGTAVAYLLIVDFCLYLAHRTLHRPRLFRAIHRWHHRTTTPNAITAMSMHPAEFFFYHAIAVIPLFILPIHFLGAIGVLVYNNYVALMDHSGIRLSSRLPWQAPTLFHDDHHRYFHVNYGQALDLWDRLLGTSRREGRRYGAEVFGGKGQKAGLEEGVAPPPYIDYREIERRAEEARRAARQSAASAADAAGAAQPAEALRAQ